MAEMFRQHLGRELTAEERKFLGLSSVVTSIDDSESRDSAKPEEARRAKAS